MSASTAKQTAVTARVATSTTFAVLLAAQGGRNMATITNESAAILYVKFGNTASATDYTVPLAAGAYYEVPLPIYGGLITGILASGTGNAQVTSW